MSCAHIYLRGPNKGQQCTTKLQKTSQQRGFCGLHDPKWKEEGLERSKRRAQATRANLYLVTIDNTDQKFFKKAPSGIVHRMVHEARAKQLQSYGAIIKQVDGTWDLTAQQAEVARHRTLLNIVPLA